MAIPHAELTPSMASPLGGRREAAVGGWLGDFLHPRRAADSPCRSPAPLGDGLSIEGACMPDDVLHSPEFIKLFTHLWCDEQTARGHRARARKLDLNVLVYEALCVVSGLEGPHPL